MLYNSSVCIPLRYITMEYSSEKINLAMTHIACTSYNSTTSSENINNKNCNLFCNKASYMWIHKYMFTQFMHYIFGLDVSKCGVFHLWPLNIGKHWENVGYIRIANCPKIQHSFMYTMAYIYLCQSAQSASCIALLTLIWLTLLAQSVYCKHPHDVHGKHDYQRLRAK